MTIENVVSEIVAIASNTFDSIRIKIEESQTEYSNETTIISNQQNGTSVMLWDNEIHGLSCRRYIEKYGEKINGIRTEFENCWDIASWLFVGDVFASIAKELDPVNWKCDIATMDEMGLYLEEYAMVDLILLYNPKQEWHIINMGNGKTMFKFSGRNALHELRVFIGFLKNNTI